MLLSCSGIDPEDTWKIPITATYPFTATYCLSEKIFNFHVFSSFTSIHLKPLVWFYYQ